MCVIVRRGDVSSRPGHGENAVSNLHVVLETGLLGVLLVTARDRAGVGPVPRVGVLVVHQPVLSVETHVAEAALVGPVAFVGLHVSDQVGLEGEALVADPTHKRISSTFMTARLVACWRLLLPSVLEGFNLSVEQLERVFT